MRDQPKRRTKILATIGPASSEESQLHALIVAGVDAVRLNFSHGKIDDHRRVVERVKKVSQELGKHTTIIADLQGPKIRIAAFSIPSVQLHEGDPFAFDATLGDNAGNQSEVGITYKNLPKDVVVGDNLLVDDGRLVFDVVNIIKERIECRVCVGGVLTANKGINRLGGGLSAKSLTEKDRSDLIAALSMNVDYIALSFPRSAEDIRECQMLIKSHSATAGVIAKIERAEAVPAMDEIIAASDAVMVARGDLGVEIGDAEVPGVQKQIIEHARRLNKPVITATQMMESMIHSAIPTRAEVSDVANAVLDGTDAVMLSAETASGDNPVAAVLAMSKVCLAAEKYPASMHIERRIRDYHHVCVDEAIAFAAIYTANHLAIDAILALTESGKTPLRMSRVDTEIPIYALSRYEQTLRKMNIYRGVYPVEFDPTVVERSLINRAAIERCKETHYLNTHDSIIITKGDFIGETGCTNAMKILKV